MRTFGISQKMKGRRRVREQKEAEKMSVCGGVQAPKQSTTP